MAVIQQQSTVTFTFTGKLDNGEVFKSSDESEPSQVVIGNSQLPPSVENALIGKKEGQSLSVRVPPEEGYGARQKILLQTIQRNILPKSISPKPGMILSLSVEKDGETHQVPATVMELDGDNIVIDYNHPLAGHHLNYEISILKIENP